MRMIAALALVGAAVGAVVAVVSHFTSYTLPSTFEVVGFDDGRTGSQHLATPLIHPSWLSLLPVSLGIGAVVGATVALLASRAGFRIVRHRDE